MRQLLWVWVAFAACDQGANPTTCKDVVTKARGAFDMRLERAERLVGSCELSSWNATTKSCVANAKTQSAVDTCTEGLAGAHRHLEMEEAMKKLTEFKDQICACTDSACAQRVSDGMTSWGQDQARENHEPAKMNEEETKKVTQIGEQMGKCMQKAMGGGGDSPPTNQGG
ncbi:MAG: hypothetical protein ABI704_22490 [Kofleriaceae bacterium]